MGGEDADAASQAFVGGLHRDVHELNVSRRYEVGQPSNHVPRYRAHVLLSRLRYKTRQLLRRCRHAYSLYDLHVYRLADAGYSAVLDAVPAGHVTLGVMHARGRRVHHVTKDAGPRHARAQVGQHFADSRVGAEEVRGGVGRGYGGAAARDAFAVAASVSGLVVACSTGWATLDIAPSYLPPVTSGGSRGPASKGTSRPLTPCTSQRDAAPRVAAGRA